VLVDTPGFDDTNIPDREVLDSITDWLTKSYVSGQKLNGIIYLHRITDPKMQGSALRSFNMFRQLCGNDFYSRVILGTTFWSTMKRMQDGELVGQRRIDELVTTTKFWGSMIKGGSEIVRIPEERNEARNLLMKFSEKSKTTMQIQNEIVNRGFGRFQTSAAKVVEDTDLEKERAMHKRARESAEQKHTQALEIFEQQKKEEEKRVREVQEARLLEQRLTRMRLQEEYERQKEDQKRKAEEARNERQRLAQQQLETEKKLAALRKETEVRARALKRQGHINKIATLMGRFSVGAQNGNVKCTVKDSHYTYTSTCDICFKRIGGSAHYSE